MYDEPSRNTLRGRLQEAAMFDARAKNYNDISNAPMGPDDVLSIFNDNDEHERTFKICKVDESPDETHRIVRAELINSTCSQDVLGTTVVFRVPRSEPFMASLIRESDVRTNIDPVAMENIVCTELYKFLMSRTRNNYGSSYIEMIRFIKAQGLVGDFHSDSELRKYLQRLVSRHKDLFRVAGKYIFATGIDPTTYITQSRPVPSALAVKRVSMSKVSLAIRLILESGIFGECVIEE